RLRRGENLTGHAWPRTSGSPIRGERPVRARIPGDSYGEVGPGLPRIRGIVPKENENVRAGRGLRRALPPAVLHARAVDADERRQRKGRLALRGEGEDARLRPLSLDTKGRIDEGRRAEALPPQHHRPAGRQPRSTRTIFHRDMEAGVEALRG